MSNSRVTIQKEWEAWLERSVHRYPQETWTRYDTPEEAGWCSEKLHEARQYFDRINSAAVMVVYDGAVLAAWGDVEAPVAFELDGDGNPSRITVETAPGEQASGRPVNR